MAATGAQQEPPSVNLSLLFRFCGPVKPQSRCVVHDQKIPSSARVLTMRPPRREDFALSPEIDQSTARFQAHTLWPTATGSPSHPKNATSLTEPIRKKVPTMKIETRRIPELVLAITCDKRPQRPHTAGCSRLDRLFAKDVTPSSLQCGHCVMRFNVRCERPAEGRSR